MSRRIAWLTKALASCGFLSYIPSKLHVPGKPTTGAGFIGTLAGALALPLLPTTGWACAIVLLGAFFISVVVSDLAETCMRRKDDPRIIIDEWVGFWTAMAWLPRTWSVGVAAFALFRVFDVWKPLGIRRLSHFPGGWGVVVDDIAAGVFTNVLLHAALRCIIHN